MREHLVEALALRPLSPTEGVWSGLSSRRVAYLLLNSRQVRPAFLPASGLVSLISMSVPTVELRGARELFAS